MTSIATTLSAACNEIRNGAPVQPVYVKSISHEPTTCEADNAKIQLSEKSARDLVNKNMGKVSGGRR